jgi:hypothetical protein
MREAEAKGESLSMRKLCRTAYVTTKYAKKIINYVIVPPTIPPPTMSHRGAGISVVSACLQMADD